MTTLRDAVGTDGLFTDGDWILSENMSPAGTIGVIQLKHVGVGEFVKKDFHFITDETFTALKCTEVLPGDILVSRMADPIARACILPRLPFRAVTAVDVSILRPDPKVSNSRYIAHICNSPIVQRQAIAATRGTTRPRITRAELEEIKIPLPGLQEQTCIVERLDRGDHLRRTRRYALNLCDEFVPSAFLEMFGDFRASVHKLEIVELESVSEIVSGVTKGQRHNGRETVTVPYLRVANVQDGYLDLSEIKTITATIAEARDLVLRTGDILMTEGGDFDKLGRGAIWLGEIDNCIHQNHVFRVRLDQKRVLPVYFSSFLHSPYAKAHFLKCAKQTTNLASINMTQLRATPVPLPSPRDQAHFASVAAACATLRRNHVESLRQAEHLFQTLLHQAFNH